MKFSEINFTLKNIALSLIVVTILAIVYYSIDILVILLFAILISYILNPLVELMGKIHIRRTVAVIIISIIIITMISIFLSIILPIIITDLTSFSKKFPEFINFIFTKVEQFLNHYKIDLSIDYIRTFIMDKLDSISKYTITTITKTLSVTKGAVSTILNLSILPILVFFILKDLPKFKIYIETILERLKMKKMITFMAEFEQLIGKYFRGMLLVGLILSVLYSTILLVLGVKQAILLGFITGMGVIIPYVGFALGLMVSLIVTAIQFQDFFNVLYVTIGFSVVQMLESFVITPKIVGNSLGISPIIVIVALLIGGSLFAIPGMILALPVAAFVNIMIDRYLINK